MYIMHHLSEPGFRCSSPTSPLLSAFMQVSSVEPSAISAYTGTRNWEQADGLRPPSYIDRDDVSGTDNMCYTLIGCA